MYPEDGVDAEALLHFADKRMYEEKNAHGGQSSLQLDLEQTLVEVS
jgi:hypothetical protein